MTHATMSDAEVAAWVSMARDGTLAAALVDENHRYKILLHQRMEQQRKDRQPLA